MAIRLRNIKGTWVALCAVESDKKSGDIYLDDNMHHALATKFAIDFNSERNYNIPVDTEIEVLMDTQKVRDAKTELLNWLHNNANEQRPRPRSIVGR